MVDPTTPISFGDGEYDEGSNDEQGKQNSPASPGEDALPDKKEGVSETIFTWRGNSQMKSLLRVRGSQNKQM